MRQFVVAFALCSGSLFFPVLCGAASDTPAGVPNFHQVNDHIYRGGQPSVRGFRELATLGVKTVIDLREGEAHERAAVEAAGMHYVHVPLNGFNAPKDEQIGTLLGMLDDSSEWPVFVHCRRGADRTGTVIACYRIAHDHWVNQRALDEARTHGMSWLEHAMHEYILHFEPTGKPAPAPPGLKMAPATP